MELSTSIDEKLCLLSITVKHKKKNHSFEEEIITKYNKHILPNIPEEYRSCAKLISKQKKLVCNLDNREDKCTLEGTWVFDISLATPIKQKTTRRRKSSTK